MKPPNRPVCERRAGVVKVDRVRRGPAFSVFGKVDEDGAELALVFEFGCAEQNLVDCRALAYEIELDALVVLEHLEADRVLAADHFLLGIDADVEMVVEQIVVRAVPAILAAQNVRARRLMCAIRAGRWSCLGSGGSNGTRRLLGRLSGNGRH